MKKTDMKSRDDSLGEIAETWCHKTPPSVPPAMFSQELGQVEFEN